MTNTGGQSPKAMMPTKMKYNCMNSGEKRMNPCASCPSSSVCMTDAMQIKESDTMKEKAVVKIDADGDLVKCAVGAGDGCGYRAGAKVCGKCGAMAMQTKAPDDMEDELDDEEMLDDEDEMKAMWAAEDAEDDEYMNLKPMRKKGKKPMYNADDYEDQLGTDEEGDQDFGVGMEREVDEDIPDEDNMPYRMKPKKKGPHIGDDLDDTLMGESRRKKMREKLAMGDDMDDTLMGESRRKKMREKLAMGDDLDDTLMGESRKKKYRGKEFGMGSDMDNTLMAAERRKKMRGRRLESMGMKSDSIDTTDVYLCGDSREVKSLQSHDCGNCTGACYSVNGEIDLLDVEAMAEDTFGKAYYSSYSESKDMFVVRVERKDAQHFDIFYTGNGEFDGMWRVPEEELALEEQIVGLEMAIKSAISVIDGIPGQHTVAEFEGLEAYAIEVDGIDGKSYDVYVDPLSGEVLGYDEYEYVDAKSAEEDDEEENETEDVVDAEEDEDDEDEAEVNMDAKSLEVALMEFELLAAEEELRDLIEGE